MSKDYKNLYNQYATCPYCGYEDIDSWEIRFDDSPEGSATCTCKRCERDFLVERNVTVEYSTFKIEEKQNEND